jgi:hypothetical protein
MKFHQGLAVLLTLLMPFATVGDGHRRLSDATVTHAQAEKACEHWGTSKEDCVFDVLSTGDLDMAVEGDF